MAVYREPSPITRVTNLENPANGKTMMCEAKECMGRMGSGVPKTIWEDWGQGYQRRMTHDTKHYMTFVLVCIGTVLFLVASCHIKHMTMENAWQWDMGGWRLSEERGDLYFAFFCMSIFTFLFGAVTASISCLKFQDCPIKVIYLLW